MKIKSILKYATCAALIAGGIIGSARYENKIVNARDNQIRIEQFDRDMRAVSNYSRTAFEADTSIQKAKDAVKKAKIDSIDNKIDSAMRVLKTRAAKAIK